MDSVLYVYKHTDKQNLLKTWLIQIHMLLLTCLTALGSAMDAYLSCKYSVILPIFLNQINFMMIQINKSQTGVTCEP